eukprot:3471459-Prymnesium_polylepis.1
MTHLGLGPLGLERPGVTPPRATRALYRRTVPRRTYRCRQRAKTKPDRSRAPNAPLRSLRNVRCTDCKPYGGVA